MYQPKKNENIAMNESEGDSVQLPNILKWKVGLIIENDLRFDPASCGSGLFISDENTHLRKIVAIDEWRTYRIMNTEWTEGIHYWSMRINDRGPDGTIMIGIVTKNFDTGTITQYDILRVFPFQDNIFSLSVPGSYLANVLSCGMSMKGSGTFLAICGIETLDQGKTWLLTGIDI
ncbi:unnamed protein product [Rotaria sp. Silwood2]|nr:unnamed protein product [Rotaria sp. Silwood2]